MPSPAKVIIGALSKVLSVKAPVLPKVTVNTSAAAAVAIPLLTPYVSPPSSPESSPAAEQKGATRFNFAGYSLKLASPAMSAVTVIPPLRLIPAADTTVVVTKRLSIYTNANRACGMATLAGEQSSNSGHDQKQSNTGDSESSRQGKSFETVGKMLGLGIFSGTAYLLSQYCNLSLLNDGEKPIYIEGIEAGECILLGTRNPNAALVPSDDLKAVDGGTALGGHLGASTVVTTNGKHYVRKGAASHEHLAREFIIGKLLKKLLPDIQPDVSIEVRDVPGKSTKQILILSEKVLNSEDLESFIAFGDWREKLGGMRLEGLEVAVAARALTRDNDNKFANMLVIKRDGKLIVLVVDNELAGMNSISVCPITADVDKLLGSIRDRDVMEEEEFSRVCAAAKGDGFKKASEFLKAVRPYQSSENVVALYNRFLQMDLTAELKTDIELVDSLMTGKFGTTCLNELLATQKEVNAFMQAHQQKPAVAPRKHGVR